MKVQFNQYQYNQYVHSKATTPIFNGKVTTMREKLPLLLTETKRLYQTKPNATIKDFETIIKKISPTLTVRLFSEIPKGSNIPLRTGAYYSQITNTNLYTNEISVKDKFIYLNFNDRSLSNLKIFGDFVHEATHVAQDESADRVSTVDFTRKILQSKASAIEKEHSLIGGSQGFNTIEYYIHLPLIENLRKNDDMPSRVPYADKNTLNLMYKNITSMSTIDYIQNVTKHVLGQLKTKFPYLNDNYILQDIYRRAGREKEAYEMSLKFLKDVLKINGDTDLDFRILLYDDFGKAIKDMINAT